jgi:hypothetical protein
MTRALGVRFAAVGIGPGLRPRGRHLILPKTRGVGKEELRERRVEDHDVVQGAGENRPKGVANGAIVGKIDDVERTGSIVQFARADVKAMSAAQHLAE